jgi:hypothetical protein
MSNLLFDSDQLPGSGSCRSRLFLFGLAFRRAVRLTAFLRPAATEFRLVMGRQLAVFLIPGLGSGSFGLVMIQTRFSKVALTVQSDGRRKRVTLFRRERL